MRPQELRKTRVEYASFPVDVFRKHIHQEVRSRKDKAYWMVRQQKKDETKEQKNAGKAAATRGAGM
jgi:broad specificity polyphosphatase/5'/3'-nucleotidase SurE